ncbi:MAG: phosphopyruvate hydratase [archaeon]
MTHVGIEHIHALQILDSRGNPTVEVVVGARTFHGRACVPSGASTGTHEAVELRDNGKTYQGKSVNKAVKNVNTRIRSALLGENVLNQRKLDNSMILLDRTHNKSKLGANAILGVSLASARCAADNIGLPLHEYIMHLLPEQYLSKEPVLPLPFANVINGGKHAQNNMSIQEFMIVPVGANSFAEATRMVSETYHVLKKIIIEKYGKSSASVGDEGGFAPAVKTVEEALDLLTEAIKKAGYQKSMRIALDCAASEFYKDGMYLVNNRQYTADGLARYYEQLISTYAIISIEDPFAEDDFVAFMHFTEKVGKTIQVVGDDLLVTNIERIKKAVNRGWCNALLLKVNQIGTLTESIDAALYCKQYKFGVMVSHRSGETEDAFISDLAVGLKCGMIKLGAPCRGERTAKYNELLRIEDQYKGCRLAKFDLVKGR